jgi:hypothetical protein
MKVIFLDFDGPIIPIMSHEHKREMREKAWPPCVEQLNRITDTTGAKIVVSSSWRWGGEEDVKEKLKLWGVTGEVIGITPILETAWKPESKLWIATPRGCEIGAWFGDKEIESFVILDDDDDMVHLKKFLVQTPFETGLTQELADEAIAILECRR